MREVRKGDLYRLSRRAKPREGNPSAGDTRQQALWSCPSSPLREAGKIRSGQLGEVTRLLRSRERVPVRSQAVPPEMEPVGGAQKATRSVRRGATRFSQESRVKASPADEAREVSIRGIERCCSHKNARLVRVSKESRASAISEERRVHRRRSAEANARE